MNALIAFVLAACVAIAVCEDCKDVNSCHGTTCTAGQIECVAIQDQHMCTCIHTHVTANCTMKADCTSPCPNNAPHHCVDNHCRCEGTGHHHPPGGHQPGGHQPGAAGPQN